MRLLRLFAARPVRVAFHVLGLLAALGVGVLVTRHFAEHGWPFADAEPLGVLAAGGLFLGAFAFKAWGWQRLFHPETRPTVLALATAGGAASMTGIALPGRCDSLVRIAVVRRYPGQRCGLSGVVFSLFVLGLIDNAALVPFAGVAAVVAAPSALVRAALLVVAGGGVLAALFVLTLPRLAGVRRVVRFRVGRWVTAHAAPRRDVVRAWCLVAASWTLRGAAIAVLLDALAIGFSIPLALLFLCASAAATALPISPQGAAAQAGAGAAVLVVAGLGGSEAMAFAIAVQALFVLAGTAMVGLALVVHLSACVPLPRRVTPALAG